MKAHLQIKLDNIKIYVTFHLLILLPLFPEQSLFGMRTEDITLAENM